MASISLNQLRALNVCGEVIKTLHTLSPLSFDTNRL